MKETIYTYLNSIKFIHYSGNKNNDPKLHATNNTDIKVPFYWVLLKNKKLQKCLSNFILREY